MFKVLKIIVIIFVLITEINVYSTEKPLNNNQFNFSSNNHNIKLFDFNKGDFFNKINQKIFIRTGFILSVTGTVSVLSGAVFTGLSYYFAWCAVADYLGTTDFKINNWQYVWQFVFLSVGYRYSTLAAVTFVLGITLCAISAILIPGIILLVLGLVARHYTNNKVSSLTDSIGIAIKF